MLRPEHSTLASFLFCLLSGHNFSSSWFRNFGISHCSDSWQSCFIRPASFVVHFVALWWKRWEWDLWLKWIFTRIAGNVRVMKIADLFWNGNSYFIFCSFTFLFGEKTTCPLYSTSGFVSIYAHAYSLHVFISWHETRFSISVHVSRSRYMILFFSSPFN